MLGFWTIPRASGIGVVAGLASILLWQAYVAWQEPVRPAYLAALAVTVLCGVTILLLTAADLLFHLGVLLADMGLSFADIFAEIDRREGVSGIAEKAARTER